MSRSEVAVPDCREEARQHLQSSHRLQHGDWSRLGNFAIAFPNHFSLRRLCLGILRWHWRPRSRIETLKTSHLHLAAALSPTDMPSGLHARRSSASALRSRMGVGNFISCTKSAVERSGARSRLSGTEYHPQHASAALPAKGCRRSVQRKTGELWQVSPARCFDSGQS